MAGGAIKNRTIFTGDNLKILRGFPDGLVDLIYLDPPFNSKHNYAAPIGSKAAGAAFKDTWKFDDIDMAWWGEIAEVSRPLYEVLDMARHVGGKSTMSYLIYMAIRILELHRVLKDTGSIYLHCDPTMSHYLKMVMDAVFGVGCCRNELVWCYSRPSAPKQRQFSRVHDIIFWYTKGETWQFYPDEIRQPYAASSMGREGYSANASKVAEGTVQLHSGGKFPESWIYIPPLKGNSREYLGYPTQKPLVLLERIIKASSNKNDWVLDPFCGCATACSAAERLNRKWVGIDISSKAVELMNARLVSEAGIEKWTKGAGEVIHRTDIPIRKGRRSPDIKHKLYGVQEGLCNLCGGWFYIQNLEVDHKIPRSKGGPDDDTNLQLLCGHCNRVKGDGTMAEARVRLAELGIVVR